MTTLPTGVVTFLFTDIEGSTRLLEAGPAAYRLALARHDEILDRTIVDHGGIVFERAGDSIAAAFGSPTDAVCAALASQNALSREAWDLARPIKVRMGLSTGEASVHGQQYFGLTLHRCARMMSSAHGGQVLLSATTATLVQQALPPEVSLVDLGDHRLRDLAQPERIFQLVAPDLPREFPPLRTLTAIPNNLPLQVTSFVGREQQVEAVRAALMHRDTRLLTLTGPGGTGKTRLALQVAAELLDSFPDGLYFVPLASVTDPELVPSATAQVLDVREVPGRPLVGSLRDFLRSRQTLLILDNFEQVIAAAPFVAELVGAAPGLRVVVTSRAVLRLYGEREYPVPPLALPDRRTAPTAQHLVQFEAVRLFAERARAARPDFAITDETAPAVAEICHRLDGLPLAVELAAARVRSLPPRTMLQRMERRLPLLTGGGRDLPARQRTLRDAIAWSYDLLEPEEQALFRRLAVFRGCTLEAAEHVCAGEPPRPGATTTAVVPLEIDVLDGLASLVEKSLVRQEETADGEPRFRMLETVREFALERLAESDEAGAVHRRHAQAALQLAETSEPLLVGPEQSAWFATLEREHDNLRSALSWSQNQGYATLALRFAVALWWFWSAHGHVKEGRERVTSLLKRFPLRADPATNPGRVDLHAKVLWIAGMLASMQGDHPAARAHQEESLALRRTLGDPWAIFNSLEGLGTITCFQGDYAASERYLHESLEIAAELDDPPSKAMALHALGNLKNELGELDAARAYYQESLAVLPPDSPLHGPRLSDAAVALDQGRYDEAEEQARFALEQFQRQGDRHVEALALATLGAVALARGDHVLAHARLTESITIQQDHGNVPGVAQVLERFVGLASAQGRMEGAARIAGAAEALRQRGGGPLSPAARARFDRLVAPVRTSLGEEAYAEAWQLGHALDLEEAVSEALAITEPVSPASADDTPPAVIALDVSVSVLSRREIEVAALIGQGMTNRQIAEALVIAEGTVANHVVHILSKLVFSSRAQVAVWAADHGLLPGRSSS